MNRKIRLTVNGTARAVEIPTYRTLLDCLRNDLGLAGSKEGCGVGVCGACT
ncbi:MAG TPA: 2Fe-2S iron-sulfur cluster-binding protein, partial [Methylomirabilota bacterium]|nr:2Fe-2S iron-sulfur cluster-binding protein [Methylomirabilota bacterium]